MRDELLAILVCMILVAFLPINSMGAVWRDDFNGTKIGPGWEFINPPKQCTHEVADGWFSIHLEGVNDIWGGFDDSAKLLRDAPEGDYTIETHIKIEPDPNNKTTNTWTAIIIFDNSSAPSADWWYVSRGGADEVNVEYAQNNAGNIRSSLKGIGDMDLYLKAEKVGQAYTGYYRIAEDDDWITVGSYEHITLNPLKVGFCVKSWAARSMVCSYDYFEISGDKVESNIAVMPNENLITAWGQLKK